MKMYGTESEGRFVFQKIPTLPLFTEYDCGRIVLTEDDGIFYVGGLTCWLGFAGYRFIKPWQLDLGSSSQQINASILPITNNDELFSDDDNVEKILNELALGHYLKDGILLSRHFTKRCINSKYLNFGFNDLQINANSIPYNDKENKLNTTINDYLDYLTTTRPRLTNYTVSVDDWQFEIEKELFFYSFYYKHVYNFTPIIQVYDQFGNQFLPSKLIVDKSLNRIKIYLQYKTNIVISIIG